MQFLAYTSIETVLLLPLEAFDVVFERLAAHSERLGFAQVTVFELGPEGEAVVSAAVEGKSAVYSHFYGLESASLAYTGTGLHEADNSLLTIRISLWYYDTLNLHRPIYKYIIKPASHYHALPIPCLVGLISIGKYAVGMVHTYLSLREVKI